MMKRVSFGKANPTPASFATAVVYPTRSGLSSTDERFLCRLGSEIAATSFSCAVALSCLNALNLERAPVLPVDIKHHLPVAPSMVAAVRDTEVGSLLQRETHAALSGFKYYLDTGRRILLAVLERQDAGGATSVDSLTEARSVFNSAALFLRLCAQDISEVLAEHTMAADADKLTRAIAHLDDVTSGRSPFFKMGQLVGIEETERLRGMRSRVNCEGTIMDRGVQRRVMVLDVSQGGFGVDGLRSASVGSVLHVTLDSGRMLSGTIKWTDGQKAGLKFTQLLGVSDPLICGA